MKKVLIISFIFTLLLSPSVKQAIGGRPSSKYDHSTGVLQNFRYKFYAGHWNTDNIVAFKNVSDAKKPKKEDFVYMHNLKFNKDSWFLYKRVNKEAIIFIEEEELPDIDLQNLNDVKGAIVEYVRNDLLNYRNELVNNLKKIEELKISGNLSITDLGYENLIKILNDEIRQTEKRIAETTEKFKNIKLTAKKMKKYYLVGKTGRCIIIKNRYDGYPEIEEIHYDPWNGKEIFVKSLKSEVAKEFYEVDSLGNRNTIVKYNYTRRGVLENIDLYSKHGFIVKKLLCQMYGYPPRSRPYMIHIKVGQNEWFNWPSQLSWPIKRDLLEKLFFHYEYTKHMYPSRF